MAFSGRLGQCASAHNRHALGCPRRYGPYGELFFFLLKKEPMVFRELVRLGPSIRPHGELLFLLVQKKPAVVPDSEAFNSFIGDGFLVLELKGGSGASDDDQADNVSNEDGSGDKISRFLQDWEVAKVAMSCHIALDMLCQELCTKLRGDVVGLASERTCRLSDKPL